MCSTPPSKFQKKKVMHDSNFLRRNMSYSILELLKKDAPPFQIFFQQSLVTFLQSKGGEQYSQYIFDDVFTFCACS